MAANEGNPKQLVIPHVEAPQFRTVFASGALFTSPSDSSKNWLLTFYSEGTKVGSETLVAADKEGAYTHASPPQIEIQRIRRDEVCVIITEAQLAGLLKAMSTALKGGEA